MKTVHSISGIRRRRAHCSWQHVRKRQWWKWWIYIVGSAQRRYFLSKTIWTRNPHVPSWFIWSLISISEITISFCQRNIALIELCSRLSRKACRCRQWKWKYLVWTLSTGRMTGKVEVIIKSQRRGRRTAVVLSSFRWEYSLLATRQHGFAQFLLLVVIIVDVVAVKMSVVVIIGILTFCFAIGWFGRVTNCHFILVDQWQEWDA